MNTIYTDLGKLLTNIYEKNKYIELEQPFIEAIVFHFSIEMLSANVTYSFRKECACVCTMRKGKNGYGKNKK